MEQSIRSKYKHKRQKASTVMLIDIPVQHACVQLGRRTNQQWMTTVPRPIQARHRCSSTSFRRTQKQQPSTRWRRPRKRKPGCREAQTLDASETADGVAEACHDFTVVALQAGDTEECTNAWCEEGYMCKRIGEFDHTVSIQRG